MVARNPIEPPGDDWFIAPIISYPHSELPPSDLPPEALLDGDEVTVYFKPDDESEERDE